MGGWETETGGPRDVGGYGLALSPLGKHASSLLIQIAFKNAKGVSSFIWNKNEEMTLSCPHTAKQPTTTEQSEPSIQGSSDGISSLDQKRVFLFKNVYTAGILRMGTF